MNKNGLRILSIVVSVYMVFALVWWTVLLSKENNTIKELRIENVKMKQPSVFFDTAEYKEIFNTAQRKSVMIVGEGVVFCLSLIFGLYLIARAHTKELEASEQQNNFLLAITHELKSPLTSMKMGLETLKRHKTLPEDTRNEIIQDSVQEGNRLEGLINNLLLANKIDSKYKFEKELLDIDKHITSFINSYTTNGLQTKIKLTTDSNTELLADQQALEIVYSNLIENAAKYAIGSDLIITTSKEDNQLKMVFADQGKGIPTKYKKTVFNKFFRIGSEDTRTTKGTGLGLYIVKRIIEGHKGKLNIKDNIPQGCIIEITIPLKN